ncbi:uncharacterized protein LOC116339808 [Contarinia nasturtii]|uniref:uncharacterized protein LOC116339808 n=1 Tax=Contarinia nasturtii TaxID=265458 RepID=UPI0012D3CEE4|nr:uncharacterized protein LOC116339808 [Contarinia nasturtii]
MPPKRKRGKKNASQTVRKTPKLQTYNDDDNVFEEICPPFTLRSKLRSQVKLEKKVSTPSQSKASCQPKRLRAASVRTISNGNLDDTKKHVDKTCKMTENEQDIVISDDDIELDLTPKRKLSFDSDNECINQVKRKKPNKTIVLSEEENDDVEKTSNGSNETNTQLQVESFVQNDDNAHSEQDIPEESVNSECEIEMELEIPSTTDLEAEIEGDIEAEIEADIEAITATNSIENDTEPIQSKSTASQSNDVHSEDEAMDERTDNIGNNQENADFDEILDINEPDLDDLLFDVEVEKSSTSSTIISKETNKMAMPLWKRPERKTKGKEKPLESPVQSQLSPVQKEPVSVQQQPPPLKPIVTIHNNLLKNVTVTINNRSDKILEQPAAPNATIGPKAIFKIPARVITNKTISGAENVSRDPRMAISTVQNIPGPANSVPVEKNVEASSQAPNNVQPQRLSVKDRLGSRISGKPFTPLNGQKTGFIINNSTDGPINDTPPTQRATGTTPFSNAHRNMASTQAQINVQQPHPDLPTFMRKELEQKSLCAFEMPSFATTSQRYDRIFHRIFERTCHLNMNEACLLPHECQLNHQLPDHNYFRSCINKMDRKRVIDLYDEFMCRCQKLFDFYFVDFCDYFGQHGLTDKLKKMVNDCNMRKVHFHFIAIVDGFMKTGKTFAGALIEVVGAINQRSIRASKEIIKLVLNPRNNNIKPFIVVLDSITKQENFKLTTEWINRILTIQIDTGIAELSSIIWRITDFTRLGKDYEKLDQKLLEKFMTDPRNMPAIGSLSSLGTPSV